MMPKSLIDLFNKFKVWRGEKIDYHVGTREKVLDANFESICGFCGEAVYHQDVTFASKYIHPGCLLKLLDEEKRKGRY